MTPKRIQGFSLIEAVIVMVIMCLVAVWAAPSFITMRDKSYLKGSAESLLGHLAEARLEAIRSNTPVDVSFDNLLSDISTEASIATPTFGDISLDPKLAMLEDPSQEGSVDITRGSYTIRFGITPMGQGYICDPVSSAVGYPPCP